MNHLENDELQVLVTVSMMCHRTLGSSIAVEEVMHVAREHGMYIAPENATTVLGLVAIIEHLPSEVFITVVGLINYLMATSSHNQPGN